MASPRGNLLLRSDEGYSPDSQVALSADEHENQRSTLRVPRRSIQKFVPRLRHPTSRDTRSQTPPRGGHSPHHYNFAKSHPQVRGIYLVKFAVSVTACYLAIQELITFAEVLLPFIFAVLCMIILEPLKRFIARVLQQLLVLFFQNMQLKSWLAIEAYKAIPRSKEGTSRSEERHASMSESEISPDTYGDQTDGDVLSPEAGRHKEGAQPAPWVKRAILAISIFMCMLLSAKVLWVTAKALFIAGYVISGNMDYYRAGANRLKRWIQTYIHDMHMEALDWGEFLDEVVSYVENVGSVVTENVLNLALQAVVTLIFLLYMLWSPVRMEKNSVTQEVFRSTGRYLKVKCIISALTGVLVFILLWACGLDLPAAFGLLAFLANFLPGIGSFAASALPCILAIIDVRKTPGQVLIAFVLQLVAHFCIDFFIEPVFFGISIEIHSVIVILGIWFFYQVWGVPGMLLSVPLLAVVRLLLKSMKHANSVGSVEGEDADTIVFLDNVLEGRWMSSVGDPDVGLEELELPELAGHTRSDGLVNASDDPHNLNQTKDLWALLVDSHAAKELQQVYQNHKLNFDTALLVFLVGVLFLPL